MAEKVTLHRLGGSDLIMYLYEQTKDGKPFSLRGKGYFFSELPLHWTYKVATDFAVMVDTFLHNLQRFVPLWQQLSDAPEKASELLSPELFDIWNIYLRPLIPPEMDHGQYLRIHKKSLEDRSSLTRGEAEFLELYEIYQMNEMLNRLPMGGLHPWYLHHRAHRYVRLLCLDAPPIIRQHERHRLTMDLVFYFWISSEPEDPFPDLFDD